MSLELPTDTLKEKRPKFGDKTFLQIETRPEDDISNIPFMVCISFLICTSLLMWLHSRASLSCAQRLFRMSLLASCAHYIPVDASMLEPPQACRSLAVYTNRASMVQARVANHQVQKLH